MLSQSERSLLSLSPRHKVVPVIKSRQLLISTLDSAHPYVGTILLRNCNLFEFTGLLDRAHDRGILLLDISPALAVPHIKPQLMSSLPLPFIASGLINTPAQIEAVLRVGALRVVVSRVELWQQANRGNK